MKGVFLAFGRGAAVTSNRMTWGYSLARKQAVEHIADYMERVLGVTNVLLSENRKPVLRLISLGDLTAPARELFLKIAKAAESPNLEIETSTVHELNLADEEFAVIFAHDPQAVPAQLNKFVTIHPDLMLDDANRKREVWELVKKAQSAALQQ